MRSLDIEKLKTQVLVVGGGISALMSALESRKQGLDVIIACKGRAGKSGNTVIAGSSMTNLDLEDADDSMELLFNDIINSGKGVADEELVSSFVEGAPKVVERMKEYGVKFMVHDGSPVKFKPPGHSNFRNHPTDYKDFPYITRGLSMSLPLLQKVVENNIRMLDNSPVIKIKSYDGKVSGALAIDKKEGRILDIDASVVIIAAGGGGKVFSNSNNTRDITGDSYGLVYDAGADIRDMEFVQFFPSMMYKPAKMLIENPLFGDGAVLRNPQGERFMEKYDSAGDMASRDAMSRGMFLESREKGKVYMDCSPVPEKILEAKYGQLITHLEKLGINLKKDLLEVSPATHFIMGGVAINKDGEASIKGLLACGEAAGGLHGANRLGGNALAEAVVFGARVAVKAKELVNELGQSNSNKRFYEELQTFKEGDINIDEIKNSLKKVMWDYGSLVREQTSLEKAKIEIDKAFSDMEFVNIQSTKDIALYYELNSIAAVSKMIIESALLRKESRGAHYRLDYPDSHDSNYKGNLYCNKAYNCFFKH